MTEISRFFVLKIPDSGSLYDATVITASAGLIITRCQYNRSVDPSTAFFSVKGKEQECNFAEHLLSDKGYILSTLRYPKNISFTAIISEKSETFEEILRIVNKFHAKITSMSYNTSGKTPDHLQISIRVRDETKTDNLLDEIRRIYPVELTDFDCSNDETDKSLFYLDYINQIKKITGITDEKILSDLLNQFTHLAQQLTEHGREYEDALNQILKNGYRLIETSKKGFFADIQKITLDGIDLYCFQLPGGGSIFIIDTIDEKVMIDTGYGIYHDDVLLMFECYGLNDKPFSRIILTHGDTDHCGASGFYDDTNTPIYTHLMTKRVIETNNRAYGARSENSLLEQIYTVMINLFGKMNASKKLIIYPPGGEEKRGEFPVIGKFITGGKTFEVLEGEGGHQSGMIYILCKEAGLFFTSDTILNLNYLTPDRTAYNGFAVYLVTSVNVDPVLVKKERNALMDLALTINKELKQEGKRLLICCGHGPISYFDDKNRLIPASVIKRYKPKN